MFQKAIFTFALIAFVAISSPAIGQQSVEEDETASRDYFTDTWLINQDGEDVRFFSDVLKDQIVVINFIFTNCLGACPLMTQKLLMARDKLGAEEAKKIRFISISIDPARDTPAAMREFAREHKADGNWVFLTGKQDNIDLVVKKLGQYYPDVEEHSTLVIAGNVRNRFWVKIAPQAEPSGVAEKLHQLLDG